MMHQSGGTLPAKLSGVFLAFATLPEAVNQLPVMQTVVGVLFFLSLVCAGMSSEISISETVVSGIMDKFSLSRKKVVTGYCLVAGLLSLVFTTGSGLLILDIVDHFINNFNIVFAGLIEVILLGWFFSLRTVKDHMHPISDFNVGVWWNFCIKVLTPIVLGVTAVQNLIGDIRTPYGDYSLAALATLGWGVWGAAIGLSLILSTVKWKQPV
jgi:NSS family neurotransmitter:Na+ symporter